MIITDSFVLLNLPKTGSAFARKVIKDIYKQRFYRSKPLIPGLMLRLQRRFLNMRLFPLPLDYKELILPNIKVRNSGRYDEHGTYSQTPDEYRDREVVSIVRNPYERFLSGYEFRAWARHPDISSDILSRELPQFPKLSIDDFVRYLELGLMQRMPNGKLPEAQVGVQTLQFISMFYKNPKQILENLTDEYLDSDYVFKDIANVTFLRNENLNQDLAAFLLRHGFTNDEVRFVQKHHKVNITKGKSSDRSNLWTPSSISYVTKKERMIFRILKSRGFLYEKPEITKKTSKLRKL